ncbi:hypothetical protein, partial [Cronobacter universalis]|uniref:hypothetical protein n=1 Tax=Cronobacter universalis TaxID=535744 RepID=UPI001D03615B
LNRRKAVGKNPLALHFSRHEPVRHILLPKAMDRDEMTKHRFFVLQHKSRETGKVAAAETANGCRATNVMV